MKRLTVQDYRTLRRALNDAMDERASYADAWQAGPEKEAAQEWVRKYEELHVKLFGVRSQREDDAEVARNAPTISIFELMRKL